jgi:hypothetical protein
MIVGCDFDTYKVTFVGLPHEKDGWPTMETVLFRKPGQSGDDAAIEALKTARVMLLQSGLYHKADVFFVERGFGASRRSDYLMGAFFGVIMSTCSQAAPTNVMHGGEWKKAISADCGVMTKGGSPGNATLKKEQAHVYVREVAAKLGHDLTGYGPDALDAYAMAVVGRWLNESANRPRTRSAA